MHIYYLWLCKGLYFFLKVRLINTCTCCFYCSRERPSSGADGEDVDDRLKMASPYEEESGFGGGGGSLGEAGLEGVDVLDEELDYDETMEDIEQLYLREDDDTCELVSLGRELMGKSHY